MLEEPVASAPLKEDKKTFWQVFKPAFLARSRQPGGWHWLYSRFLYRPLMRFAHRFNWHHMSVSTPHPYEGKLLWCHWCGARHLERDTKSPSGV